MTNKLKIIILLLLFIFLIDKAVLIYEKYTDNIEGELPFKEAVNLVKPPTINMNKLAYIESSNNPLKYNRRTGARGLYQITPICLKEYNNFHKIKFTLPDLFIPATNKKIAKWYLEERIPQMLRYYKKDVTIDNILICYNAGISYVAENKILPDETGEYILKYKRSVK